MIKLLNRDIDEINEVVEATSRKSRLLLELTKIKYIFLVFCCTFVAD